MGPQVERLLLVQDEAPLDHSTCGRYIDLGSVPQSEGWNLLSAIRDILIAHTVAASRDNCRICRPDRQVVDAIVAEEHWVVLGDADLQLLCG